MATVHLRSVVCENFHLYHPAGLRQLLSGNCYPRKKRRAEFAGLVSLGVTYDRGDIPVSDYQDLGIWRETLPVDGKLKKQRLVGGFIDDVLKCQRLSQPVNLVFYELSQQAVGKIFNGEINLKEKT